MAKQRWAQGKFKIKNPQKYLGNKVPTYRSSWENRFMLFCDQDPRILHWQSEPMVIPYQDPFTGKKRKYTPDFFIVYNDKHGNRQTELIEVKPKNQTAVKFAGRSKPRQKIAAINEAKYRSAQQFCDEKGLTWRVLTEQDIFWDTGGEVK